MGAHIVWDGKGHIDQLGGCIIHWQALLAEGRTLANLTADSTCTTASIKGRLLWRVGASQQMCAAEADPC